MKKIFLWLNGFLVIGLLLTYPVLAAKPTPSPDQATNSATVSQERQEQIKELRERVASRVAELREKGRRAFYGQIKSISGGIIILTTKQGEKTVLTNEDTSFFRIGSGSRKTIALKDLSVGETITAFGQVEIGKEQLTAKVIIAKVLPININGQVVGVDVEEGTITVETPKNKSMTVDIETTTKILVWEKGKGLQKLGLSKIKVGDRVHVNGFIPSKSQETNRITANRILVLPGRALGIVGSPSPSASPEE